MSDGQGQSQWKGNDEMVAIAERIRPEMVKMLSEMSTEQLEGALKFFQFWKENVGAGHKNIFKMAPVAFKDATSLTNTGDNNKPK